MIRANIIFRPHAWINTKSFKEMFGVQARVAGRRGWMHVADGKPCKAMVFRSARARDRYLAKCRAEEIKRRRAANAKRAAVAAGKQVRGIRRANTSSDSNPGSP